MVDEFDRGEEIDYRSIDRSVPLEESFEKFEKKKKYLKRSTIAIPFRKSILKIGMEIGCYISREL